IRGVGRERAGEIERAGDRVALAEEVHEHLLGRYGLNGQIAQLYAGAVVERQGEVGADGTAADRGRDGRALKAGAVPRGAEHLEGAERERPLLRLRTGLIGLRHPEACELDAAREPRRSERSAQREIPLDRPGDRGSRAGRGRNELLDVLALETDLAADGRVEQGPGAVHRDDDVGDLHGEIAGPYHEAPLEGEL